MVVTLRQLKRLNACPSGLEEFRLVFGAKARVTRKNMLLMSRHVGFMAGSLFPEHAPGLPPNPGVQLLDERHYWVATNALADAMGLK